MKYYDLMNFQSNDCKVVLSTSYVSPLSKIFVITNELKSLKYKGEVLFDLLLSNGFAKNRFIKMYFDGEQLAHDTTKVITHISEDLLKEIYTYYSSHPEYVDKSSLSHVQKHLLKKNLIIK